MAFSNICDDTFDIVLSYLGQQTLMKLQEATGETYDQCDQTLVQYCCRKCDDDKPAIRDGLCTRCHSIERNYRQLITKAEAVDWYGINSLDGASKYYDRAVLDATMMSLYGTTRNWLLAAVGHAKNRDRRIREEYRQAKLKSQS